MIGNIVNARILMPATGYTNAAETPARRLNLLLKHGFSGAASALTSPGDFSHFRPRSSSAAGDSHTIGSLPLARVSEISLEIS